MDSQWIVGFVVGLLLLLILYQYLTNTLTSRNGDDALSHTEWDPRDVSGVDHEWQGLCPRQARQSLVEAVASHHRAVMYRKGTTWKVQAGTRLSVVQRSTTGAVTMYYIRGAGPTVLSVSGFSPVTTDDGFIEHPNTAVSLAAAIGATVVRYDGVTDAQRALPPDTATERHFVVVGQPNDPSAYVVRVPRHSNQSSSPLVSDVSGVRVYERRQKN